MCSDINTSILLHVAGNVQDKTILMEIIVDPDPCARAIIRPKKNHTPR